MTPKGMTDLSGWVLVALLALTIALPYRIRASARANGSPPGTVWRAHFWTGYLIAALTLGHSWIAMRPDIAGQAHKGGLYLATGALFVVAVQTVIGLLLRRSRGPRLRGIHFWSMLLLVGLAAGHVVLSWR
jgi:hypothetical protein